MRPSLTLSVFGLVVCYGNQTVGFWSIYQKCNIKFKQLDEDIRLGMIQNHFLLKEIGNMSEMRHTVTVLLKSDNLINVES